MNDAELLRLQGGLDECANAIIGSAIGAVGMGISFASLPVGGPFSVAGFVASYAGFMWSARNLGACQK
jgi:hypothetical protein